MALTRAILLLARQHARATCDYRGPAKSRFILWLQPKWHTKQVMGVGLPRTRLCYPALLDGCAPCTAVKHGVLPSLRVNHEHSSCTLHACNIIVQQSCDLQGGNRSEAIDVELDSLPDGAQSDASKPFFVLSHFDHRISTRQVTYSGATGRRRNQSEVATVLFNLANEPWMKYNPSSVADCGFAAEQYTVSRFHTDTLYLESHS